MSLEFPKVDLTRVTEEMDDLNASLRKFAEDIQKRKDNAMAIEFTRVICDLLKENGVTVEMMEIEQENHAVNKFEVKYGYAFTGLDFSEHDKKVVDEKDKQIAELEKELKADAKRIIELIAEKNEIKERYCFDRIFELEEKLKNVCDENHQLKITVDVLSKRIAQLMEVHEF